VEGAVRELKVSEKEEERDGQSGKEGHFQGSDRPMAVLEKWWS
jgi:hypothetical protein